MPCASMPCAPMPKASRCRWWKPSRWVGRLGRAECRRDGPRLRGQADTSNGTDNTQFASVKLALALVPGYNAGF